MVRSIILRYFIHNQFIAGILFIGFLWFIFQIKGILIALFVAYILTAAVAPYVEQLQKKKVPRPIAIAIPYLAMLIFIGLILFLLVPFFIEQLNVLIKSFPGYLEQAARVFNIKFDAGKLSNIITSEFDTISRNALDITTTIFSGLFSLLTVLVVSFYLLLDHNKLKDGIVRLFPSHVQKDITLLLEQIEEKLGAWLRGQLVLSVSIGLASWIALTILGLEFALPLAIIAGIFEVVPTIGPILGAIPAVIVALNVSPALAILVVVAYIIIQTLEANILVPKIMEKAVGLNPLVILLAILIGGELLGVMGALLSIPLITVLVILFNTRGRIL